MEKSFILAEIEKSKSKMKDGWTHVQIEGTKIPLSVKKYIENLTEKLK